MSTTPTDIEHEVKKVDIIVTKGDAEGNITYANPIFVKLSGYTQGELLDKPHSIVRHPDMPKIIFKFLWDQIKAGKDVKAFVKNLSKDGAYYWVYAHVRVATNPDGSFRNYVSTRKAVSPNARTVIEPLYKKLLEAEKEGGMEASAKLLEEFLEEQGASFDTFNEVMDKIQNS
ncbi:PAS domain-containing protein [Nitratifractor salsuginis]|uniref:PAS sensor protein n=1 Tax=Nitratifractor salsuginis (strain DSM 16511 / JCM 12458 / E9I37-1) TaxID=749222 RepID=E6X041_NITSE|nr:PAS domain-containing protein [Nitratifractor salsuginis]ADV46764.1 PAS sensor protein [Nitratifractor salsuginis DSM 16511]